MTEETVPFQQHTTHRRPTPGMGLFVIVSLLVTLSFPQLQNFEQGSLQYWILLINAIIWPLLSINRVIEALVRPARLLLMFALLACAWWTAQGDITAVLQLGLLVMGLAWVASSGARLPVQLLAALYVFLILLGATIAAFTTISPYGLIPGWTVEEFGRWRVSFFPNIAYTGLLSLAMFMILTRDAVRIRQYRGCLVLVTYFLLFSFVRAATIGAILYLGMRWLLAKRYFRRPRAAFWLALSVGVGFHVLLLLSAAVIVQIQDWPGVSELLLQGKYDLSAEQILYQMYRPWLWLQHIEQFLSSPWMMGWGSQDFATLTGVDPATRIVSAGTESLPTRLLAVYGIPGLLFTLYLLLCLLRSSRARDYWACACFPSVLVLLTHWGSVFHPTDGLFVIFFLLIVHGSKGFTGVSEVEPHGGRCSQL